MRFLVSFLLACQAAGVASNEITVEPPTVEALRAIERIDNSNVLAEYVAAVIDSSQGELYDQKVRHAVDHHLSEQAAAYHFVTICLGMWGNGGMQDVLLCEPHEIRHRHWELQKTADAFRSYGCTSTATFLEDLIPKAVRWSTSIAELNQREIQGEKVPEADFDRIWSEVDGFDSLFEETLQSDPDVFEAMTRDIREHPERYVPAD